jgi:hypothetical protein
MFEVKRTKEESRPQRGNRDDRGTALVLFALLLCTLAGFYPAVTGYGAETSAGITYNVSFDDYSGGSTLQWLAKKGFVPQRDAANQKSVVYSFADNSLVLETKKRAAGLLLNETQVLSVSRIRIAWGVDTFPAGASYLNGVRSEAVMVLIFFGSTKLPSGSLLIPDSPYFIGLFLCDSDPIDQAFTGRYFRAGGRYICVGHAVSGKLITSDYSIADAFKRLFGKSDAPTITGFGIAIDTESAKGSGTAKSFIKEIEFIK